jgi:hypothetical protein
MINSTTYTGTYEDNIDADPHFLNTGEHPFMLMPESPCTDMGNPDTTGLYLPDTDLAGNPRTYNNRVDIGVYEYGIYPPYFTSEPIVSATVNQEYDYVATAKDPTGHPLTFDYNVLPEWLSFNTTDTNFALLTGIPQTENIGESPVEIMVSNPLYETSQSFIISITEVGMKENPNKHFIISPNPTSGIFQIKDLYENHESHSIELFNSFGKKLMEFETIEKLIQIDLSEKPKGVYLIRIKSGLDIINEKIIIR